MSRLVVALAAISTAAAQYLPPCNVDSDCVVDGGYSCCQWTQTCIRPWIDPCEDPNHGCLSSAGYTWCDSLGMCVRTWETPCPMVCMDDASWHYADDFSKDCAHVAEKPEFRCDTSGSDARPGADGTTAAESCPMACGTCPGECADSTSWIHSGDPNKDCPWVGDDASDRCRKSDNSGVTAFDACQKTCGTCDEPDCLESAGYSWCAELGQCVQVWTLPPGSPCAVAPETDDDVGCCTSCGEVWCDITQTCIYPWLQPCGLVDDHDCYEDGGYVWCPIFGRCVRPWEEPCTPCQDSTSWVKRNNENVDCAKVAEDPGGLCDKQDLSDVYAHDACPVACGTCDSHGCIHDAGYFWCPQTGRCEQVPLPPGSPCRQPPPPVGSYQQSWTPRSAQTAALGGDADDEHECCHSCGYSWCQTGGEDGEGACERPWETPCESGACGTDSESWHKKGDPSKDCAWVAGKTDTRCDVKGEDKVLAGYACPNACRSKACGDDADWHKRGEPAKTCSWVSIFPRKRCFVRDEDRVMALQACPYACRYRNKVVEALTPAP